MSSTLIMAVLAAIQIHVAPQGDDAASGTRERPVATLQGARDALRRARGANPAAFDAGGAEVVLADGVYRLTEPLALTKEDGGDATRRVVWCAANRGRARVSGGLALTDWREVEEPAIHSLLGDAARRRVRVADIPGTAALPGFTGGGCGTPQRLLETPVSVFQGERRLEQAHWPDDGYARTGRNIGETQRSHDSAFCKSGTFLFASDRLERWAREPDAWFFGLWNYEWADATVRLRGIDLKARSVSVDPDPIGFGIREGAQFRIVNAVGEIDRPGEWALDRTKRKLYCWLPEENRQVTLAVLDGAVDVRGAVGLGFDGIVFEHFRKTVLTLKDCEGCSVSGATIRHTSSWGVVVDGGRGNQVVGCDLHDLGEGGVTLAGGDADTLAPANHLADNNHIHHYGNVIPNYRPGVQLRGVGNRATHNLIHHSRHQAIAFDGNDHYIGFNVCHDCCTYNDDAGTIYCCQRNWTKRGTVIEHNLVHMTGKQPRSTHTEAIYLDDFSSGVIVRNNLINRASLGIYVGGGQDCRVYGNLVMNCVHGLRLGSRGVETFAVAVSGRGRESEMFRHLDALGRRPNAEFWRSRYPNMMRVYNFADGQFAHNALFNVMTNNVLVGCCGLQTDNWRNVGPHCVVTNNLETAEDPGFVDYAGLDWTLRPDSEAFARLGDLRFGEMGLYASDQRASPAVKFGADCSAPRPLGPEYELATVRVDVPFVGQLPAGTTNCVDRLRRCDLPAWGRGSRVVASFGAADAKGWREYAFSFTPAVSGPFELVTMGTRGEKTLYDDFRVTGADFANGGFEWEGGWTIPTAINPQDYRFKLCNTSRPWGVVTDAETGVPAAEGTRCFCGNDIVNVRQRIDCRAGVPVTVTFKARAAPLGAGQDTAAPPSGS